MKKNHETALVRIFKARYTKEVVGPVFLFTFFTVLMTWPLALKMYHSVTGYVGDSYYFIWLVDWFKQALFELHQSPFFVPYLNYPEGYYLAYNAITPAMVLIALPFSLVGGPVLGYNISIFISFILSGFGTYLLVYRLSKNKSAAIIAGTIFAFIPFRMAHLFGHFNLMGTQWFPFYFLTYYQLLKEKEVSWKTIIKPALFLGLIAFTSQYYLMMTLIISFVFLFFYILTAGTKLLRSSRFRKKLFLFTAMALPLVFIAILPYLQLSMQGQLPSHTLEESSDWSASPTDFFKPSPFNLIWGKLVKQYLSDTNWIESTLYIGIIAFLAAVTAFVKRRQIPQNEKIIRILTYTCIVTVILAMGTNLYWMGKPVKIDISPFTSTDTSSYKNPDGGVTIPLPGRLLCQYLPFYSNMRVWMRYGVFVNLFISVLAGLGCVWLLGKIKPFRRVPVTVLLILLILLDFYQVIPEFTKVKGRPVDYWLEAQTEPGAVAEFPVGQLIRPEQAYYTLIHKKPFIGAMALAFPPPQFKQIVPVLHFFPSKKGLALLRRLMVRYIVLDKRKYNDISRVVNNIKRLGVPLKKVIGNHYVFVLD